MALKSELMASGMPWELARLLGFDPPVNFTAAGASQTTATTLTSNHAVVNAGSGGGVILGDAQQMWFVQNGAGVNVTVYPPVVASFSGLSQNAGITVSNTKALFMEPGGTTGITWSVSA